MGGDHDHHDDAPKHDHQTAGDGWSHVGRIPSGGSLGIGRSWDPAIRNRAGRGMHINVSRGPLQEGSMVAPSKRTSPMDGAVRHDAVMAMERTLSGELDLLANLRSQLAQQRRAIDGGDSGALEGAI